MRKFKKVLLIASAGLFCLVGQGFAAEGSWTGPYVGLSGGTIIGTATATEYNGPYDYGEYSMTSDLEYLLGIQAGYNLKIGSAGLIGIEADLNLSGFDEERKVYLGSWVNSAQWNYFSTLRLRGGLVSDNTLIYVTGGVALVDVDYEWGDTEDSYYRVEESETELGYAAGAGVEIKIRDNLNLRGEYLYIGLPTTESEFEDEPVEFESHAHTLKIGFNFLF